MSDYSRQPARFSLNLAVERHGKDRKAILVFGDRINLDG